ncbi:MAG: hypothetical protein GY757_39930 [bacterium]|nr:hypothetical protein [bacterium]
MGIAALFFLIGVAIGAVDILYIVVTGKEWLHYSWSLIFLPVLLVFQSILSQNADAHGMVGMALFLVSGVVGCFILLAIWFFSFRKKWKEIPVKLQKLVTVNRVFCIFYLLGMFLTP